MTSVVRPKFFKDLVYQANVNRWRCGIRGRLPEHYRQRMIKIDDSRLKGTCTPVHYRTSPGLWELHPTKREVIYPVQNRPIPVIFPAESQQGLWGGEGIVRGMTKKGRKETKGNIRPPRIPKIWMPTLEETVLYSEILNEHYTIVVTRRTKLLVDEAMGFDNYILKTPPEDLRSTLGLKMKKAMLTTLMDKTMYPNDPEKCQQIYDRYAHFLTYTRDELEWLGLSEQEAIAKQEALEREQNKPRPLKHIFAAQKTTEKLPSATEDLEPVSSPGEKRSWSWNPFKRS